MVQEFPVFRMNWNTGEDCSGNRNLKVYSREKFSNERKTKREKAVKEKHRENK
jgi:hypothetical protein